MLALQLRYALMRKGEIIYFRRLSRDGEYVAESSVHLYTNDDWPATYINFMRRTDALT